MRNRHGGKKPSPSAHSMTGWLADTPAAASFWFNASNVVLVVGAVAVAIGTYGAIQMGSVKERFSNERVRKNEADTATANATAAAANERAVVLEKEAANARVEQERLAQSNLAVQQRLVAAERDLEAERSERLKLESNVRPRTVTQDQRIRLISALQALSPRPNIAFTVLSDEEARQYANEIGEALTSSHVRGTLNAVGMMVPPPYGVLITIKKGSAVGLSVQQAFKNAGIATRSSIGDTAEFDAQILVGLRPLGPTH